jgi:hypothetical protein
MTSTVYRSEIDTWLLITFRATSIVSVLALAPVLYVGLSAATLIILPILALAVGLPWWILSTTTYTLTDRELLVRSGPFHWNISLRQITSVKPTRSPLSSPALSLDRLRIERDDGSAIMISPERRRQFLDDLTRRGVAV